MDIRPLTCFFQEYRPEQSICCSWEEAGYGITTVNFPQGKWQAAVKGEGPIAMIARSQTMATGDT